MMMMMMRAAPAFSALETYLTPRLSAHCQTDARGPQVLQALDRSLFLLFGRCLSPSDGLDLLTRLWCEDKSCCDEFYVVICSMFWMRCANRLLLCRKYVSLMNATVDCTACEHLLHLICLLRIAIFVTVIDFVCRRQSVDLEYYEILCCLSLTLLLDLCCDCLCYE